MLKVGVLVCLIVASSAVTEEEALRDFGKLSVRFDADVAEIVRHDQHDRGIISPISAQLSLALIADGAKGRTDSELRRGLSIPGREETRLAVKALVPLLNKKNSSFSLTLANKLYVKKDWKLNEDFKKIAGSNYHTEIESIQFSESAKAAKKINDWVANQTNNKIKTIIKEKQLTASTRLVLVNTIYLNGKWETPFPPQLTKKETFHFANNKTGPVDTMHSAPNARYLFFHCGFLRAKFLEIPYKDSTVSATFVLPDDPANLPGTEDDLEEYLKPHNLTLQRVRVSLPKFTAETEHDFTEILGELGVSRAFNATEADLSGISSEKGLYVNLVQQKAFLNITESGTEVATATAVGVGVTSVLLPPKDQATFIADHRFIFYIRESKSNVILFLARFR